MVKEGEGRNMVEETEGARRRRRRRNSGVIWKKVKDKN
jgi:hypothetical protein